MVPRILPRSASRTRRSTSGKGSSARTGNEESFRARSSDLLGGEQGREPTSEDLINESHSNKQGISQVGAISEEEGQSGESKAEEGKGELGRGEERQNTAQGQTKGDVAWEAQPANTQTHVQAQEQAPTASEDADRGASAPTDERGPDITASLDVDCLDVNLYRSKELWVPARARGVFGGQVIGQAVMASNATVREDVFLHSLHCYFLLAGDKKVPILYHVKRLRDGGSYVTRSVEAVQRGRCIFTIMLSYQKPEPQQPSFALPLPRPSGGAGTGDATSMSGNPTLSNTAPPEGLYTPERAPLNEERYIRVLREKGHLLDEPLKRTLQGWIRDRQRSAVEIRDALPGMYDANGLPTAGYEQAFWMRTRESIAGGEDEQKAALAYASDFYLLSTIPKALGNSRRIKMMASLDHSMWFYDSFDTSQWMLFVMQTQAAGSGRGVAMGRVYRQDGTLVAVVSQEGLVRGKLEADGAQKSAKL